MRIRATISAGVDEVYVRLKRVARERNIYDVLIHNGRGENLEGRPLFCCKNWVAHLFCTGESERSFQTCSQHGETSDSKCLPIHLGPAFMRHTTSASSLAPRPVSTLAHFIHSFFICTSFLYLNKYVQNLVKGYFTLFALVLLQCQRRRYAQ